MFDLIEWFGRRVVSSVEGFGIFTRFSIQTLRWFVSGANKWARSNLLMPQLFQVGTRSIPVVMLTGAFIGMVLAVEAYDQFAAIGQESRLGGIIGVSLVRQIGPVLAAVMLAGRVGGAVSAELGTMKVTEQLDAMRVMGADPVAYLVVPRVLACVVMIPVLTIFSDLTGIYGGWVVSVRGFGVNSHAYWEFSNRFVGTWDWSTGVIKSIVFGLAIGLISCYKGFYCRAGAAGVGRAATDSFVTSFLAIIVINLVMAKFLKDLGNVVLGHGGPTAFNG